MDKLKISKSYIYGDFNSPASKSVAHRAIICACLANEKSVIKNITFSKDIVATINAARALGATVDIIDDSAVIYPIKKQNEAQIDCFESGSTLRFFIPIAMALSQRATFKGQNRLITRPLGDYIKIFDEKGYSYKYDNKLPLTVDASLKSGDYHIAGDKSSQFISGLLFALPLANGDSKIILTTKLESESYVNMTIGVLKDFGIEILKTDYGYFVKGNQKYIARDYSVEGDFSNAAFFLTCGALNSKITCRNLNFESLQGDKKIIDILKVIGADIKITGNAITVKKDKLLPFNIDATDIPDLVPIMAVAAAFLNGKSKITGVSRLKYKESDRLLAVSENLKLMGVKVKTGENFIEIWGTDKFNKNVTLKGYNDHRIVMAFSIMASIVGDIFITDSMAVEKSYPFYWDEFKRLGGII